MMESIYGSILVLEVPFMSLQVRKRKRNIFLAIIFASVQVTWMISRACWKKIKLSGRMGKDKKDKLPLDLMVFCKFGFKIPMAIILRSTTPQVRNESQISESEF